MTYVDVAAAEMPLSTKDRNQNADESIQSVASSTTLPILSHKIPLKAIMSALVLQQIALNGGSITMPSLKKTVATLAVDRNLPANEAGNIPVMLVANGLVDTEEESTNSGTTRLSFR